MDDRESTTDKPKESMATITCSRKFSIDVGHRVVGHEGACKNHHGHTYRITVTATCPQLDTVGRVIDFSVLKDKVGRWLLLHWDHGFVLWDKDGSSVADGLTKVFRLPTNPTAENLAAYLLMTVCPQVLEGTGIVITKVRVDETPNCYAEAEL